VLVRHGGPLRLIWSGFATWLKETKIMKNTAIPADTKASTKPSIVPPNRGADQKRSAPVHHSRLEAHKQALKNEASLNALTLEFQNALKKSIEGFIEAGKVLIRAKNQVKKQRVRWEDWVIRTVRFGERKRNGAADLRKAQELMLLARHPVISNPKYFAALPPRIQTLYVLSQILDDDLRELIEAGVVHQGLTRKEAAKLKPRAPNDDPADDDDPAPPAPAAAMQNEAKVLLHFVITVARPDVVRAYQRSLKREPGLPSKEDFDRAVQFAQQIYESRGGQ
jgi:hypothetical protein